MDEPFPDDMMDCIKEFFKTERSRGYGLDCYDAVFASNRFFPLQRKNELIEMMRIARSINPNVVMEIGADKGGGLYHWCKCLESVSRVIACEIRGTPYKYEFENAFPYIDFLWIEDSSYDPATVAHVSSWLGKDPIDCLFIDGDKSHFDTDFEAYLPRMNPNGIVFMHDINDDPPRQAFELIRNKYTNFASQEIVDIREALDAIARREQGIPSTSEHENWLRHWEGRSAGVGVIRLCDPS